MLFNSKEIIKKIKSMPGYKVSLENPGGDVDTVVIHARLNIKDERGLLISGFSPENYSISPKDNVEVELVELCALDADSGGGVNGVSNPHTIRVYADLLILLSQMGFKVVNCMKDYF